jgi:cell division septal protein FtsQ
MMAQKKSKKTKASLWFTGAKESVWRSILSIGMIICALFILALFLRTFLYGSDYFKLKTVRTDSLFLAPAAGQSISNQIIKAYGGRNVFGIPLGGIAGSLGRLYPDSSDISVKLALPDRLNIALKFRRPVAVVRDSKLYPIDDDGFVLPSVGGSYTKDLPIIDGASVKYDRQVGRKSSSGKIKLALELLKSIRASRYLSETGPVSIDASNISNISFVMKNGIKVFVGSENFDERLYSLERVLRDPRLSKDKIKYIDVSTQDVVIGPKDE